MIFVFSIDFFVKIKQKPFENIIYCPIFSPPPTIHPCLPVWIKTRGSPGHRKRHGSHVSFIGR